MINEGVVVRRKAADVRMRTARGVAKWYRKSITGKDELLSCLRAHHYGDISQGSTQVSLLKTLPRGRGNVFVLGHGKLSRIYTKIDLRLWQVGSDAVAERRGSRHCS